MTAVPSTSVVTSTISPNASCGTLGSINSTSSSGSSGAAGNATFFGSSDDSGENDDSITTAVLPVDEAENTITTCTTTNAPSSLILSINSSGSTSGGEFNQAQVGASLSPIMTTTTQLIRRPSITMFVQYLSFNSVHNLFCLFVRFGMLHFCVDPPYKIDHPILCFLFLDVNITGTS